MTDYSYTPIYTLKEGETQGGTNYSRVVRVETAREAHLGNYLDKTSDATDQSMEYALQRVEERIAHSVEVTCPDCDKEVVVLANKYDVLVSSTTCACGYTLPAESKISDYD